MFKRSIVAALALASASAFAAPIITFGGMQEGAFVNDYYNGGTDSFGNRGPNYGVSFGNAIVHYNKDGAYVAPQYPGSTISMSVNNTALTSPGIAFWGDGWHIDAMSWAYSASGFQEPTMTPQISYMPSYACADCGGRIPGWYEGQVFRMRIQSNEFDLPNRFSLNLQALDDISFGTIDTTTRFFDAIFNGGGNPNNGNGNGNGGGHAVPLPGTAWLMAIGLFAVSFRKKYLA